MKDFLLNVSDVGTDLFEPGSTFKPINMAIALETQSIATTDRIQDPGSMVVGTETIMNVEYDPNKSYQEKYLTPAEVLKYSSNVGMVRILQKLSPDKYYDWLTNLCDGSNLTADLPNVGTQSQLKSRSEFCNHPIEPAAASFGQGLSMTPLKLLQLTAAIGNGGYLVTPHVVSGILEGMGSLEKYLKPNLTRQDLQLLQEPPHSEDLYFGHIPIPAKALGWRLEQTIPPHARTRRRIFSPITTRAILQMLEEVILDGTGKRCFLPGYRVAGKTGTAQKASQHGGYLENAVVTSFIALYPVQNPKYATLVVIDEPEGPYGFASNTAADLTQAVISKIIFLNREPETYPRISLSERIYPNWISK
jgi:cell division protein FtsI (penicillin-binding protein 3)